MAIFSTRLPCALILFLKFVVSVQLLKATTSASTLALPYPVAVIEAY
ncbi:hypothetical protein [Campylobacter concisus]|nr:hypothetical protein [Campylobacter concisus]